jgi:hypothetical protein
MGWAEMTNQALWHAADMGHMHQKVHVSEHDMGPGHEKEPAVVIHMNPDADFVDKIGWSTYHPSMHEDLPKVVAMDFLSNNIDRHPGNLLFLPPNAVDEQGQPPRSRLLAIDHGRSFQYHAANREIPTHIKDQFLGTIEVDPEMRSKVNQMSKESDNLLNYARAPGIRELERYGFAHGLEPVGMPSTLIPGIAKWWPHVRDQVMATMQQRLEGIKEPRMREHLMKNFETRVAKLDDISARPDWWLTQGKARDLAVPLHVWDRG